MQRRTRFAEGQTTANYLNQEFDSICEQYNSEMKDKDATIQELKNNLTVLTAKYSDLVSRISTLEKK